jgi:hypothetical protein
MEVAEELRKALADAQIARLQKRCALLNSLLAAEVSQTWLVEARKAVTP